MNCFLGNLHVVIYSIFKVCEKRILIHDDVINLKMPGAQMTGLIYFLKYIPPGVLLHFFFLYILFYKFTHVFS